MLAFVYQASFLASLDDPQRVLHDAETLSGRAPLPVDDQATLPAADGKTTWVVLGRLTSSRADAFSVVLGADTDEPNIISVRDETALLHLVNLRPNGGIQRVLEVKGEDQIADDIRQRYAKEIARLDQKQAAYVFGGRRLGEVVANGLRANGWSVAGVLDNNRELWGKTVAGGEIWGLGDDLDRSIPIIIGTTRFPYMLRKQLCEAGFECVLPYPLMTFLDAEKFPEEIPYCNIREDLVANRANYVTEYLSYSDDKSRLVMDRLMLYRLTLDPDYIQGIFEPESEQYFDKDIIRFSSEEVFIDAGGFDGQTTLWFIGRVGGKFNKIYFFEPDGNLMERSKTALADSENIEFIQAGVFDTDGEARFSATGTVNGAVSLDVGDSTIDIRRVDSIAKLPATFIKMDVEGAELAAIRGSEQQIRNHQPRLAVACYHRGEHIWQIGRLIRKLGANYRLDLRHYTEGGLETVIYARPHA